jgi:hypothetical protein
MPKNKKKKDEDLLTRLVSTPEKDMLAGLILTLAGKDPEIRRNCFEYLKKHAALPQDEQGEAEGEALMALWRSLSRTWGSAFQKKSLSITVPGSGI